MKITLDVASFAIALLALIVSVWGDRIRLYIAAPRLRLSLQTVPRGTAVTLNNGQHAHMVLIKVQNSTGIVANNCRVEIVKVERSVDASNLGFAEDPLVCPLPLKWSFPEYQPPTMSLSNWHPVDLGSIVKGDRVAGFKLSLKFVPNSFDSSVGEGSRVRYHIRAAADNARQSPVMMIEVAWDGNWCDEATLMRTKHLIVKEIDE